MAKKQQVRCGNIIWIREWGVTTTFDADEKAVTVEGWGKWQAHQHPSISLAKKANGLNSRKVESPKMLPDFQPA